MTRLLSVFCCLLAVSFFSGCKAFDQVLVDFHLKPASPDQTLSELESVVKQKLTEIGTTERDRLNQDPENVSIEFVKIPGHAQGVGEFLKAQRRYERFFIRELKKRREAVPGASEEKPGYEAILVFNYVILESPHTTTRAEALTLSATIESSRTGSQALKYLFDAQGEWDGKTGIAVK